MNQLKNFIIVISSIIVFSGCGVVSKSLITKAELYPKIYEDTPLSILVLPAKNTTTSVDATNHFRYTITKPLAEKGYYVFPVHLVDNFFKSENLSDAELIREIPIKKLKEIFNADAVLYVDINAWDTNYAVLASSVDVGLSFSLVSTNTEKEIWHNNAYSYSFSGGNNGGGIVGLIVSAIKAAINTTIDYTELANVSNGAGVGIMPVGKYHKRFHEDNQDLIHVRTNTNLKDGKLFVSKYFIYGNNKEGKVALTIRGRAEGYHAFSVLNYNNFIHNGYKNYYFKKEINNIQYLKNRFFRYENNQPYLLANNKKVFVYTETDGTIPFTEENGEYYLEVERIVELNIPIKEA